MSSSNNTNKTNVPEAKEAMNRFKPRGKRSCFCGEESESGGLHP